MIKNPIPWPNGAKCAACISFDMDADSLIHISDRKHAHDRPYPISMGRYGPDIGVPRIVETYRRLGMKQSFFIPGWCVEQYPDAVDAILDGGHEIGHHGYLHEDPTQQTKSDQTADFEKALELFKKRLGKVPAGYRAPVYNINQTVIDLLVRHGFEYDSSMMGDDIPYRIKTEKGELYEAPVHWGTDDWPPFAHYAEIGYMMPVRGPSAGLEAFFEEFEAQYEAGGFWLGIWHPFLTGRLARWRKVEDWLEGVLKRGDVWFAPLQEIIGHVRDMVDAGRYEPNTHHLPYYDGPVGK